MDIVTEEFSQLEIVGGNYSNVFIWCEWRIENATDESDLTKMLDGNSLRKIIYIKQ